VTRSDDKLKVDSALIVVAHPDDCEFMCGGTVAGWTQASAVVTLLVATDGAKGSHDPSLPDAKLSETRQAEQREAAAVLGIRDVHFLDVPDGGLKRTDALLLGVVRMIRSTRPDVVVSFDPWRLYELHPDHRAVGWIACDAAYRAKEPRFDLDLAEAGLPPWRPSELWLVDAQEPNHVEDVSAQFETKLRAILCHKSQYATSMRIFAGDPGSAARFEEGLRASSAGIGEPCGYRYGERFRRIEL
jgi:LmbE family N-acetylglucosaminyl deacetylase